MQYCIRWWWPENTSWKDTFWAGGERCIQIGKMLHPPAGRSRSLGQQPGKHGYRRLIAWLVAAPACRRRLVPVLIVAFVSLVFQTSTENGHWTCKLKQGEYGRYCRYRRHFKLKIPTSYRFRNTALSTHHCCLPRGLYGERWERCTWRVVQQPRTSSVARDRYHRARFLISSLNTTCRSLPC